MLASQMFPCYKVFPEEISLCSASSSAPPKTMRKCSPRVGAESGRFPAGSWGFEMES